MRFNLSNSFNRLTSVSRPRFDTVERLVEGLRCMDTNAIEYLMDRTEGMVRNIVHAADQPSVLAKDLLHDGLIILIEKIRTGNFDPEQSAPSTYLIGICRKLLSNHLRSKLPLLTEPLEKSPDIPSEDFQIHFERKNQLELIEWLLGRLGPPGDNLIRLKYLEGYSDEEQIKQKMTPYSTLDSLKNSRSQYMKKLALLAQDWKERHEP